MSTLFSHNRHQWPLPTNGRRHSALPSSFLGRFFFPLAESPCFHSHSRWSCSLRCQLGSSISNGCCHLRIEVTSLFPETLFRRDRAVTRTRRFATNLPSSSCSLFQLLPGVTVPQRLVHFTTHPQGMQQHRQLPRHCHDRTLLRILSATCGQLQSPAS